MTEPEFSKWRSTFHRSFPSKGDDGFSASWLNAKTAGSTVCLADFTMAECLAAIDALQADSRIVGVWPSQFLPWLLEILVTARQRASQGESRPGRLDTSERAPRGTAWNRCMLKIGAITKAEFERREGK